MCVCYNCDIIFTADMCALLVWCALTRARDFCAMWLVCVCVCVPLHIQEIVFTAAKRRGMPHTSSGCADISKDAC